MNLAFLKRIEDAKENLQLIEVEIFNEASKDMVWQNANPDFQNKSRELETRDPASLLSKTEWKWGSSQKRIDGKDEVWEDEVTGFTADLPNNCENKRKFQGLQRMASQ